MALACAALLAVSAALAQSAASPAVTGAQALHQLYDKRDAKRVVEVKAAPTLRIGR